MTTQFTSSNIAKVLTACPASRIQLFQDPINKTLNKFEINTPLRAAAFLAQIGHESGQLRYVKEIWGPTPAQAKYEGRKDLGNTVVGDGKKFMGRGLIQVTGRANYTACGKDLGLDLVNNPSLLEDPIYAVLSAGWFWNKNGLNALADQKKFETITRRINGGTNGLEERVKFYRAALKELGVPV